MHAKKKAEGCCCVALLFLLVVFAVALPLHIVYNVFGTQTITASSQETRILANGIPTTFFCSSMSVHPKSNNNSLPTSIYRFTHHPIASTDRTNWTESHNDILLAADNYEWWQYFLNKGSTWKVQGWGQAGLRLIFFRGDDVFVRWQQQPSKRYETATHTALFSHVFSSTDNEGGETITFTITADRDTEFTLVFVNSEDAPTKKFSATSEISRTEWQLSTGKKECSLELGKTCHVTLGFGTHTAVVSAVEDAHFDEDAVVEIVIRFSPVVWLYLVLFCPVLAVVVFVWVKTTLETMRKVRQRLGYTPVRTSDDL